MFQTNIRGHTNREWRKSPYRRSKSIGRKNSSLKIVFGLMFKSSLETWSRNCKLCCCGATNFQNCCGTTNYKWIVKVLQNLRRCVRVCVCAHENRKNSSKNGITVCRQHRNSSTKRARRCCKNVFLSEEVPRLQSDLPCCGTHRSGICFLHVDVTFSIRNCGRCSS